MFGGRFNRLTASLIRRISARFLARVKGGWNRNATINRFFSEKHNLVDILIIDGKNRAIVTQVAIFDRDGKMTHCEWKLVSHSHYKEHLYLTEANVQPNDIFKAIDELNINKRIKMKKRPFEIENPTDTHRAIWKWWKDWVCPDFGMHPVTTEKLIETFEKAGWKAPANTPVREEC